jgi:hypothetical protein
MRRETVETHRECLRNVLKRPSLVRVTVEFVYVVLKPNAFFRSVGPAVTLFARVKDVSPVGNPGRVNQGQYNAHNRGKSNVALWRSLLNYRQRDEELIHRQGLSQSPISHSILADFAHLAASCLRASQLAQACQRAQWGSLSLQRVIDIPNSPPRTHARCYGIPNLATTV